MSDYIIGKQIGQGAYAVVRIGMHKKLNKKVALKIYEKEKINLRVWMKFTNADGAYLNAQSQCLIELSKVFKDLDVEIARDEILYLDRK